MSDLPENIRAILREKYPTPTPILKIIGSQQEFGHLFARPPVSTFTTPDLPEPPCPLGLTACANRVVIVGCEVNGQPIPDCTFCQKCAPWEPR